MDGVATRNTRETKRTEIKWYQFKQKKKPFVSPSAYYSQFIIGFGRHNVAIS